MSITAARPVRPERGSPEWTLMIFEIAAQRCMPVVDHMLNVALGKETPRPPLTEEVTLEDLIALGPVEAALYIATEIGRSAMVNERTGAIQLPPAALKLTADYAQWLAKQAGKDTP